MGGRHRLRRATRHGLIFISSGGAAPVPSTCDETIVQEDGFSVLQEDSFFICAEDPDLLLLEASIFVLESGNFMGLNR